VHLSVRMHLDKLLSTEWMSTEMLRWLRWFCIYGKIIVKTSEVQNNWGPILTTNAASTLYCSVGKCVHKMKCNYICKLCNCITDLSLIPDIYDISDYWTQ